MKMLDPLTKKCDLQNSKRHNSCDCSTSIRGTLCVDLISLDAKDSNCISASGPCTGQWIGFWLFDRQHLDGQYVEVTDTWNNLTMAGYVPGRPTDVLIHGFNDNFRNHGLIKIKDELVKLDHEVLMMDWSPLAWGCYFMAVENVEYAGGCLAALVNALGRPTSNFRIIGFSLGAHIPAPAASLLKPYILPRVTGLDPALPGFFRSNHRLSKSDIKYLDVLHTNAFLQGYMLPLGHADFYMNGGTFQPGCGHEVKESLDCAHQRAVLYFAESINTKVGFWGCNTSFPLIWENCYPDNNSVLMGYHMGTEFSGIVNVKTASKEPFALGRLGEGREEKSI